MKPSSHVNIDGDVITYAVGFAAQRTLYNVGDKTFGTKPDAVAYAEKAGGDVTKTYEAEPLAFALSSAKRLVKRIVESSKATTYTILLTGKGNFREKVASIQPYKGNRDDSPKPIHYHSLRDYLTFTLNADICEGEEADDQLSVRAVENGDTIATIDKDLDNTAGWHYNWQHDELYYVEPVEADRNFYRQLLVGDATDNIPGLYRITGKRASAKIKAGLEELTEPKDMYEYVRQVYLDTDDMLQVDDILTEIGQLLWMRRSNDEMWEAPCG